MARIYLSDRTQLIDNVALTIETTWIEDSGTGYDRVVIMNMTAIGNSGYEVINQTIAKIKHEIGLVYDDDYIFSGIDTSRAHPYPIYLNQQFTLRLKEEEHFTMLKLHYHA